MFAGTLFIPCRPQAEADAPWWLPDDLPDGALAPAASRDEEDGDEDLEDDEDDEDDEAAVPRHGRRARPGLVDLQGRSWSPRPSPAAPPTRRPAGRRSWAATVTPPRPTWGATPSPLGRRLRGEVARGAGLKVVAGLRRFTAYIL